jgi:acetylornithine deacetylase/succinyl-diaminopimelate desuccinylase-like protein
MDQLLKQLVAIPSVAGDLVHSEEAVSFCANYLKKRGMFVHTYKEEGFSSLVATTRETKKPTVLLAGHLDVIDAPPELFTLRLENGIYYGRGVWDMKYAAAIYLHLVDELQDRLADYNFGIMLTTDEETYGEYGTGFLVNKQGYKPSVCILPDAIEPGHIQEAAKGCYFAEVSVAGVSAHGSRPWEGDSASIKLIEVLHKIATLFEDKQKLETATLNIGMLHCGETINSINKVPDSALATLDIRFPDLAAFRLLEKQIAAICQEVGVGLRQIGDLREPVHNDLDDPYITNFVEHFKLQTGRTLVPYSTTGTSDARYFCANDIPCISVSPKGGGCHADTEWLDAADAKQFMLILRAYLDDFAKQPLAGRHADTEVALTIPA